MLKKNKKKIILFLLLAFVIGLGYFFASSSSSKAATQLSIEDIGGQIGLGTADLKTTVINIIKWVLGILTLVAVSIIIYGGILWMTAAGSEERIRKAKKVIIGAVIGLIIVLLAWAIVLFVARALNNATGGGACSLCDGAPARVCSYCDANACSWKPYWPPPPSCGLSSSQMSLDSIKTAHEESRNDQKVYLCSNIQAKFNRSVDSTSVEAAVSNVDNPLQVQKLVPSGNPEKISGSWITTRSNVNWTQGQLFETETDYQVVIPKTLKDTNTRSPSTLKLCNTPEMTCIDSGDHFIWPFKTGTKMDTTAPQVVSGYPVIFSQPGYPDQNVNRDTVLQVDFSETIDITSASDGDGHPIMDSLKLQKISGFGSGATVQSDIESSKIIIDGISNGFSFRLEDGLLFEPFSYYRITVNNVKDLCGNKMAGPVVWEFETNDVVAGFKKLYPKGDKVCPDESILVVFSTTMFYNRVDFRVKEEGGPEWVISMPSPIPDPAVTILPEGTLRVNNPDFSYIDTNFTAYEIIPSSPFKIGKTYTIDVNTDKKINQAGDVLKTSWSFKVASAEQCLCAPIIYAINPSSGQKGQCVTVQGKCFTGTAFHTASVSKLEFDENYTSLPDSVKVDLGDYNIVDDRNITTTIPPDFGIGTKPIPRVTIDFGGTIGTATSDDAIFYNVNINQEARGPCLMSLKPTSGYRDITTVVAGGKRFSSAGKISFSGGTTPATDVSRWTDTEIWAKVPPNANSGNVIVKNDQGDSNGIFFTVLEIPPGTPIVIDHWPTCNSACVNAEMGAVFGSESEMDADTLNTNTIRLFKCGEDACSSITLADKIEIDNLNYLDKRVTFTLPASTSLVPNTPYRIIFSSGTGTNVIKNMDGAALGRLNYDDPTNGTGEIDSYSWIFKTKNDASVCELNRVDVLPTDRIARVGDNNIPYHSDAYGSPDECDPRGQKLRATDYNWNWSSSNSTQASLVSDANNNDSIQGVDALQATTIPVQITSQVGSISDFGNLTIKEDLVYCNTTAQCTVNKYGESCNSRCVNNKCTPVINSFRPASGEIKTWVTVSGCWFGNYVDTKSKVLFSIDKEGLPPNVTVCGSAAATWTNERIVREVPVGTTNGQITVVRNDAAEAKSSDQFTVDNNPMPGICKLNPNTGKEQTSVSILGKNFGSQGTGDKITFAGKENPDPTPSDDKDLGTGDYISWADDTAQIKVPVGAKTGNVYLSKNDGRTSNGWPFTVISATCTVCSTDAECSASQGCGYDKCCYDRPAVTTTSPIGADICRNAIIRADFNALIPMDRNTLNTTNIQLSKGSTSIDLTGKIRTYNNYFEIRPGLLDKGATYKVEIKKAVKSSKGVSLAGDYTWTFTTLNNDNPCAVSYIKLDPSYYLFTKAGATHDILAKTYYTSGPTIQEIDEITGFIEWSWTWESSDPSVVTIPNTDSSGQTMQAASPGKNGTSTIKATAKGGVGWLGGEKSGTATARVILCEEPWQFDDTSVCTLPPVACNNYNFSLFYCRGKTADPNKLPEFKTQSIRNKTGNVLKQYLFKEADSAKHDAIGIRIYENLSHLSPSRWYQYNVTNPGSPSSTTVDGYEAVRDGTTVYVAATNLVENPPPATIYGNIYLLSYNADADANTRNIYNQMLAYWTFNTNMDQTNKPLIVRDLKRIADLSTIASYLDSYKQNKGTTSESYPSLVSGSYLRGISTSKWPSWQSTLGNALGKTLPVDPINQFEKKLVDDKYILACEASGSYKPDTGKDTCWSENNKQFICPTNSHIYGYSTNLGADYNLYAHLEYTGPGNWISGSYFDCPSQGASNCSCFNYKTPL